MSILRPKFIRWKYVIPRLAILLILALVVRFGLDPALKWGLVTSGQSSIGAKIDLATLHTSLWDGQLTLEELAVTNPHSPLRNLLEAEKTKLKINVNSLLHGHVVVEDGSISGMQFDSDRETSGALADTDSSAHSAEESGPSLIDPLLQSAGSMGTKWFDDLGDRLNADITDQLKSPQLAKELQSRWPTKYKQLRAKIESIQQKGRQLENEIRDVKSNPLRGLQRLPELQAQLKATQQEVQTVQKEISSLPQQADDDRKAILAAREQDEAFIRQQLQIGSLDEQGLTQTLLGEPVAQNLSTALGWISWAREQIPSKPKPKKMRSRGSTVIFSDPQPDYLVKQLNLQGTAQLNGQPLQLTGSLKNASSNPQLILEPTRLELQGSNALDVAINIVLDRRHETAIDKIHLNCPQLAMHERLLGNPNKLSILVSPGPAQLNIDLTITDEQLEGQIAFTQNALSLTPKLANSKSQSLSTALSQAMPGVENLKANVSLAGTIKKPKIKINSDLGSQVAQSFNSAVKQLLKNRSDTLLADTRKQVDKQLQKINQLRTDAEEKLLAQLGENQQLLSQLASLSGGAGNNGFSFPAAIPQLGKSLRPDTQKR